MCYKLGLLHSNKIFNIILLSGKFLFPLLSFAVDNMEKIQTNSDIHSSNTKHEYDFHKLLNANLTSEQKGAYYAGNKLFSTLPSDIKCFKSQYNSI